tara:strand:- start:478 stop:1260 length:783 start_codon:yes stop_codon:yes gene_type:complete
VNKMKKFKSKKVDALTIRIDDTSEEMAKASARHVANTLKQVVNVLGKARLILATGTSQIFFLDQLQKEVIPWDKITVFHLDEYVGIEDSHPACFRNYLKTRILDRVKPKKVFYLNGDAPSIHDEIERYSNALSKHPIDLACIGIGENGHLAFNDPGVANFDDPQLVKSVFLDQKCRQQQYDEGWFDTIEQVPKEAITLTIPAIMNVQTISCVVPETRKAKAIYDTLEGVISEACPASVLRRHPNAFLFLDLASAAQLRNI